MPSLQPLMHLHSYTTSKDLFLLVLLLNAHLLLFFLAFSLIFYRMPHLFLFLLFLFLFTLTFPFLSMFLISLIHFPFSSSPQPLVFSELWISNLQPLYLFWLSSVDVLFPNLVHSGVVRILNVHAAQPLTSLPTDHGHLLLLDQILLFELLECALALLFNELILDVFCAQLLLRLFFFVMRLLVLCLFYFVTPYFLLGELYKLPLLYLFKNELILLFQFFYRILL